MKKKITKQNNYAFIDSQNVNLAIRDQGWKLDWKKYRIYLKEKYQISKAFLFIGYIEKNKSLYTFLKYSGFEIVFKPTIEANGETKGNVDAELVLHTMIQLKHFDKAIINTGDGDFYCLVDYLNNKNKLLKLLVPNVKKYSKLLKPFAPNKVDFMNNLRGKLEYFSLDHKKRGQLHKDKTLRTSLYRDTVNILV